MNIRVSSLLSFYFFRVFSGWFGILFVVFSLLAVLIESAELLRRSATKTDIPFELIAQMAFLKVPFLLQKILPLFVLFASVLSFRRLQKNSEIIVARSSGFSLIQLLFPLSFVVLVLGALEIMVVSPWVSLCQEKFEKLENRHIRRQDSQFVLSDTGLWLKQSEPNGYTIVHVRKAELSQRTFQDVSLYFFQEGSIFQGRLDSPSAVVKKGYWELKDPIYFSSEKHSQETALKFRTFFTPEKIEEFFAPAATMSIWKIPSYIRVIEKAGFTAISYRVRWHLLLGLPIALMGMFLIGSALAIHNPRRSKGFWKFCLCFFVGFLFYILQDITQILSTSFVVPVEVGLWVPPGVLLFLSIAYVIYQEH